jgi:hypothetical protein
MVSRKDQDFVFALNRSVYLVYSGFSLKRRLSSGFGVEELDEYERMVLLAIIYCSMYTKATIESFLSVRGNHKFGISDKPRGIVDTELFKVLEKFCGILDIEYERRYRVVRRLLDLQLLTKNRSQSNWAEQIYLPRDTDAWRGMMVGKCVKLEEYFSMYYSAERKRKSSVGVKKTRRYSSRRR